MKKHPDLYKKVIKGGFWVTAARIATQILSIIRLAILARLLTKAEFGLIGIALLLIGILETFTNTGFQAALIKERKDIKPFLDTAWVSNIIRGFILYGLLFFLAPVVVQIKIPQEQISTAVNIIRTTGLCLIIRSFSNIGIIYFQKELDFKRTFLLNIYPNLTGITISIVLALILKNYWALVAGSLSNALSTTLLSYKLHPFRPKFKFDLLKFFELWKFGKWVTQSSIIYFLMLHGDDILVWSLLGVTNLAYYQMGYKIATTFTYEITNIVNKIVFPAFSKVSSDIKRLKAAYFKSSKMLIAFNSLFGIGIAILAKPIVLFTIGENWISTVPIIQILSIRCIFNSFGALRGPLWLSMGKPSLVAKYKYYRIILLIILIYPLTVKYGIIGTAFSISIVTFLMEIPEFIVTLKMLNKVE